MAKYSSLTSSVYVIGNLPFLWRFNAHYPMCMAAFWRERVPNTYYQYAGRSEKGEGTRKQSTPFNLRARFYEEFLDGS